MSCTQNNSSPDSAPEQQLLRNMSERMRHTSLPSHNLAICPCSVPKHHSISNTMKKTFAKMYKGNVSVLDIDDEEMKKTRYWNEYGSVYSTDGINIEPVSHIRTGLSHIWGNIEMDDVDVGNNSKRRMETGQRIGASHEWLDDCEVHNNREICRCPKWENCVCLNNSTSTSDEGNGTLPKRESIFQITYNTNKLYGNYEFDDQEDGMAGKHCNSLSDSEDMLDIDKAIADINRSKQAVNKNGNDRIGHHVETRTCSPNEHQKHVNTSNWVNCQRETCRSRKRSLRSHAAQQRSSSADGRLYSERYATTDCNMECSGTSTPHLSKRKISCPENNLYCSSPPLIHSGRYIASDGNEEFIHTSTPHLPKRKVSRGRLIHYTAPPLWEDALEANESPIPTVQTGDMYSEMGNDPSQIPNNTNHNDAEHDRILRCGIDLETNPIGVNKVGCKSLECDVVDAADQEGSNIDNKHNGSRNMGERSNSSNSTSDANDKTHTDISEPENTPDHGDINNENTSNHNETMLEFLSLPIRKSEVMFCSGKNGLLESGDDDVDMVFDAIMHETEKEENKEKDLMVIFVVGGDFKVLRRPGVTSYGDHVARQDVPSMTRKDLATTHNGNPPATGLSLRDINAGRPKSVIVTRSHSFGGVLMDRPPGRPLSSDMSAIPGSPAAVLGESFRHRSAASLPHHPRPVSGAGFSFRKSPKMPKVPRPNRALLMFQSVRRGIREFIDATKEDIVHLHQKTTEGTSTSQQIKSAERYLKRLEFHISKLDELHEYYMVQQQLREGVRTMHHAYIMSPGSRKASLSNVKYGYKECSQTMCAIEAQLEAMMGTFNCKLKGIAGFARLCPGDVFEVTVRHGTQKWKTKGRIEKSGTQRWDIPEFNFKAVVGDIISIKGVELRAFKTVLLGQKSCETKDLFSANPQLMTVSINVNGSLKLSIVITWNPLDGVEESASFIEAPLRPPSSARRRPVSVIALNGSTGDSGDSWDRRLSTPSYIQQTKDDNFILRTNTPQQQQAAGVTSYHGFDSPHVRSRHSDHTDGAHRLSPDRLSPERTSPEPVESHSHTPPYQPYMSNVCHSSPVLLGETHTHKLVVGETDSNTNAKNQNIFSNSLPPVFSHQYFPSVSLHGGAGSKDEGVVGVEDAVHNLSSSLEDYHGQYTELMELEKLATLIHKLVRKQSRSRSSSVSSNVSISIESALGAFDFLNTEEGTEDPQSPTNKKTSNFDDLLCSPESTAKTGDSGIESLAQRLSEDTQLGSSLGSSPEPPSTGNEQVDQCLMYHLVYCDRLLQNLGMFGPLKCREIYALDKLQKQTDVIKGLVKVAKSGSEFDLHSVLSSICDDKTLREFWVKCTDINSLYIHPDRLLAALEQKFGSLISDRHALDPTEVCKHVITRVLDVADYDGERTKSTFVLTLHQFMVYFNEAGGLKNVDDIAAEMKLIKKFTSGNVDVVIKAILTLRDELPSAPCLKVLGMLLVCPDKDVEQCCISYLNLIQKSREKRDEAMVVYVEGLEDRLPEIRSGACVALAILEASESVDQLVYLWQSDTSTMVQRRAKDALLSMGEDGLKAFEEAQLSRHGFQGIQVHK